MSTYSQSFFFSFTWKRRGVWIFKLGEAINDSSDKYVVRM